MRRYIHIYIIAAVLALAFSGCEGIGPETALKPGLYLSAVTPGADVATKAPATMAGETSLNENLLKSVYYFLYAKADEDSDPSTALPILSGHFSGLESETRTTGIMAKRNIPISAGIVNELFPPGTKYCRIVVVANPTSEISAALEAEPNLAALRAAVVTADFAKTTAQESFVMVYDELVEVTGRLDKTVVEIEANLKRLANKITVETTVADGFYDKERGWYVPMCEGLRVTFCNGFSKANLKGDFSSLSTSDSDWFESAETSFGTAVHGTGADTTYKASSAFPIYSYPMKWEFADAYEPYLLFELPWQNVGASKSGTTGPISVFYYKIMLSTKQLVPNSWYNMKVTLKILGSPNKVEPTQQYLYEDYQVFDWVKAFESTYNNVDADIREARYLMVNETNFVLNNQPTWNIPFASSHECEIVNATYTTTNYAVTPPAATSPASVSGLNPACNISISGNVITFSKNLRNDITAGKGNYDYVPYDYTFTIRHVDNHEYSQTITIRQYPALYIDATVNSSGANVPNTRGTNTAYVNNNTGGIGGITIANLGGATTGAAASNKNGTMYVVSISALPTSSEYIIMDPRTPNIDLKLNSSNNWSVTAPALYDGSSNRQLKYYYPTYSDRDHEMSIAPKFRIASSWGATQAVSYDNAVRRCAAYQEDGFPAGRWRIPTRAEMEFMIKLSVDDAIPMLFNEMTPGAFNTTSYFCASGGIFPRNDGTVDFRETSALTTTNNWVRCVYDEWYWENTDSDVTNGTYPTTNGRMASSKYSTFVWGDMPR